MEKKWILLIAILIFLIFTVLFWWLTSGYAKKGYGKKMWDHWPTKLSYWQAAILYSIAFTAITMYLLKLGNCL
jgi:sterol desaturase/sphingolipid hydroxylase (fatty acid hydroxylase superfamily)